MEEEEVEAVAEVEVIEVTEEEIVVVKLEAKLKPDTRVPNTRISLLESGLDAVCISNGGKELFSVRSRPRVPGGTSMHQSLQETIENLTSSASVNQH